MVKAMQEMANTITNMQQQMANQSQSTAGISSELQRRAAAKD